MADPIKWDSKIIAVKAGAVYGTDSGPTGANAMLIKNAEIRPMEGQDLPRNIEQAFQGAQEEFSTGLHAIISGEFELVGSGDTGVAPAWSPILRSCGVAEVVTPDDDPDDGTVEYTPVTDGQEWCDIHFYIGTTRHVLLGARGTTVINVNAQGVPVGRFTLTGLFATPSNQARITPDLSGFQLPEVATHANTPLFTVGGIAMVMSEFSLDLGCRVEPRLLIGRENIIITGKQELISARVEALPLGTFNPFSEAVTKTRREIKLQHGVAGSGRGVLIEADQAVQRRLTGYQNSQNVTEWPLQFTPMADAGDDQWKITLN